MIHKREWKTDEDDGNESEEVFASTRFHSMDEV